MSRLYKRLKTPLYHSHTHQIDTDTFIHTAEYFHLPLRLARSLIAYNPYVAYLANARFGEELIDLFLVGVQVDPRHQHRAVVALGLLSLPLSFLQVALECLLPLLLLDGCHLLLFAFSVA